MRVCTSRILCSTSHSWRVTSASYVEVITGKAYHDRLAQICSGLEVQVLVFTPSLAALETKALLRFDRPWGDAVENKLHLSLHIRSERGKSLNRARAPDVWLDLSLYIRGWRFKPRSTLDGTSFVCRASR